MIFLPYPPPHLRQREFDKHFGNSAVLTSQAHSFLVGLLFSLAQDVALLQHGRNHQRMIGQIPQVGSRIWPGWFLMAMKPAKMLNQLELWYGASLGLKKSLCVSHHHRKACDWRCHSSHIILDLGEGECIFFPFSSSCFFVKRFPSISFQVSFYSSDKEGSGCRKASMQWQLYSPDGVAHPPM